MCDSAPTKMYHFLHSLNIFQCALNCIEVCFEIIPEFTGFGSEFVDILPELKADLADLLTQMVKHIGGRNRSVEVNMFTQFQDFKILEQVIEHFLYSQDPVLYLYSLEIIS